MKRLQRQAGKYSKRSMDGADVSTILQEFQIADQLLDAFMDAVRSFQTAWRAVLGGQLGTAQQLETLYRPIHDSESNFNTETDPSLLDKALQLKAYYAEMDKDLEQETTWIQTKLLQPAMDAKQSMAPLKKVIKKRENYKLDFERYQSRVDHARQKGTKTPREETALSKHESDLSQATVLYHNADDQIKRTFPAVIDAVQALVPLLMTTQIMLQHALVGQLYTVLHDYCQQFQFPSPAPPMEDVIASWEQEFTPIRHEVEGSLQVLVTGKAIHQPMRLQEKADTVTGLSIRGRVNTARAPSQPSVPQIRRTSTTASEPEQEEAPPSRPPRPGTNAVAKRVPSSMSIQSQVLEQDEDEAPPQKPPRPGAPGPIPLASKPRTPSSMSLPKSNIGTPLPGMSPHAGLGADLNGSRKSSASTTYATPAEGPPRPDYFGQQRNPSTSSLASSIAGKKKPPPPPVKRRTTGQELWVTALYDFAGQGGDDLAFREGDRIKVVKKTESTDDWWLGELRGASGSFPANYVQLP